MSARSFVSAALASAGWLALSLAATGVAHAQAQTFDLVVSLQANPLGDDERMQRYEEILQDFSDAVFQATEGAHAIGQVTIHTASTAHDRADIIWQRRGRPMSTLNGLQGPGHIYMADTFTGGAADGSDLALTTDPDEAGDRAAGAVLAHEWAHYAYGLLDEHFVETGDLPVTPSLMHSPWRVEADARFANFSIVNSGGGDFQNTLQTAHHRAYGVSAWELLATPPDIADLLLAPTPGRVERDYFMNLAAVAPPGQPATGESAPAIPAPIWTAACSRYVIAIDNSGSMTGLPLSQAKGAADTILSFMAADTTWVSILTFANETVVLRTAGGPVQVSDEPDMDDETERDRLADLIAQIAAAPAPTRFSRGLTAATTQLAAAEPLLADPMNFPTCDPDHEAAAVFFISDGSNSNPDGMEPTDVANALATLSADGIPVYPLDVGSFDPDETSNEMTLLAAETGGILLGPTASFNQALQAWAQAEFQTRPAQLLHATPTLDFTVPETGTPGSVSFPVDGGLDRIAICASSDLPVGSLSLSSPSGVVFPAISTRDTDDALANDTCSTFWALDSPSERGNWQITGSESTDPDVLGDANVSLVAQGYAVGATYALQAWVSNASASTITAPQPIFVTASLGRERPIVGARLSASLGASGAATPLRDDGIPPDATAGDGIYVGAIAFDQALADETISVTATNSLGIGALSSQGLVRAPNINDLPILPEDDVVLGTPMLRLASIGGIDTIAETLPPPVIDNAGTILNGRIATPGEVDSYFVDLPAIGSGDLEIRVTGALLGMAPRITVLQGTTEIATVTANPGAGGVTVPLQASDGLVTAEVRHAGGGTGTYQISAGPRLGLPLGSGGLSDSPCDLALSDKDAALLALEAGLLGTPAAIVLIEESASLEWLMIEGIRDEVSPIDTGKAGRFLKRALTRDAKALKRLRTALRQGKSKELKGARNKIENARSKLTKACSQLADGGASLIP